MKKHLGPIIFIKDLRKGTVKYIVNKRCLHPELPFKFQFFYQHLWRKKGCYHRMSPQACPDASVSYRTLKSMPWCKFFINSPQTGREPVVGRSDALPVGQDGFLNSQRSQTDAWRAKGEQGWSRRCKLLNCLNYDQGWHLLNYISFYFLLLLSLSFTALMPEYIFLSKLTGKIQVSFEFCSHQDCHQILSILPPKHLFNTSTSLHPPVLPSYRRVWSTNSLPHSGLVPPTHSPVLSQRPGFCLHPSLFPQSSSPPTLHPSQGQPLVLKAPCSLPLGLCPCCVLC